MATTLWVCKLVELSVDMFAVAPVQLLPNSSKTATVEIRNVNTASIATVITTVKPVEALTALFPAAIRAVCLEMLPEQFSRQPSRVEGRQVSPMQLRVEHTILPIEGRL